MAVLILKVLCGSIDNHRMLELHAVNLSEFLLLKG